jgi:hypothetical protein
MAGVIAIILCQLPAYAQAAVTEKDVLAAARIISFLEGGPKGEVQAAILTDGPQARANAASFVSLVGDGQHVGNITLSAKVIRPEDLATTDAKIILIPEGMDEALLNDIFDIAQKRKLVTISFSDVCLAVKRCAIAIKTEPAVDIKLSISAAQATEVSFTPTLRMMIKEEP